MNTESSQRQGGDPRGRSTVRLDLSTCVNPYGPPETVLAALRSMPASAIRAHPYGAAHEVETAYAEYTSRPVSEFVAGRGTSDLIWSLAQQLDGKTVGLPMPAYTEFRQAFPHARPFGGGPSTHPVEVLDEAMQACDAVILSNPHNPTGQFLQRDELAGVASRHPDSVLVVDESYIDFLADGAAAVTLVGCTAGNVIVLRSPSKFFGLAGLRSGVAWSLRLPRARWENRRTNWPVSVFAAQALRIALAEHTWAAEVRQALHSDAAWLKSCLAQPGLHIAPGALHFRLLTGSGTDIARFVHTLEASGIAVRVLEQEYGVGSPAVRISSPHRRDRWRLAAALGGPQPEGALCPIV